MAKIKIQQIKKYSVLAELAKFNARQILETSRSRQGNNYIGCGESIA